MIDSLYKFLPWASSLPLAAKIPLSIIIVMIAAFLISGIWFSPPQDSNNVSEDEINNLLFQLVEIQLNYDARWREVEPLARRTIALISEQYPTQALEIQRAQETYPSVNDIVPVLKTQLQVVKDELRSSR